MLLALLKIEVKAISDSFVVLRFVFCFTRVWINESSVRNIGGNAPAAGKGQRRARERHHTDLCCYEEKCSQKRPSIKKKLNELLLCSEEPKSAKDFLAHQIVRFH